MSRKSSRCVAAVAMLAGSGLAAVGFAGPASADTLVEQYIEVPQCQPNTSQECPQKPQVDYTAPPGGARIKAHFTANANHCSDLNVRLLKDDPATGVYPLSEWLRVGPGQTVDSGIIEVPAGGHFVRVFAKGIEGGCNIGHLDAWGGTVRIETLPKPTPVGQPDVPQFQLPDFGVPGPPDGIG
jgi:hypothetical protein